MRYPKQSTESHNVAENGGHCRKRILSQVSKDPAFGFIGENSDQVSDGNSSPLRLSASLSDEQLLGNFAEHQIEPLPTVLSAVYSIWVISTQLRTQAPSSSRTLSHQSKARSPFPVISPKSTPKPR